MPLACLKFSLNVAYKELYLIDKNKNFTSGLVNFRGMLHHQRITKKFSKNSKKSTCRDYSNEQHCDSQKNCIDRCISTEFIKKHGSIPTNTVVNSKHLPSFLLDSGIKFNETVDKSIKKKCATEFNEFDCVEVYFEETTELVSSKTEDLLTLKITSLNRVEMESKFEKSKIFLDIVSQASIFFGLNVTGALSSLFFVITQTLKLKLHKAYSVTIFFVAAIGFLSHNVLVFQSIIQNHLIENEFFEKPEKYIMPSPVFCFRFSKEDINENHRFTGKYLDDLTQDLTFKQVFKSLDYHNKKEKIELEIGKLNSTKSSNFYADLNLILTHFYYAGLKCFKISLNVSYEEEDFYFLNDKNVLNLKLEKKFTEKKENSQAYFFYQKADSNEIGGGFTYPIGKCGSRFLKYGKIIQLYYRYVIEFELFKMVREDKFELLKDPRNFFYEKIKLHDLSEYLNAMKKQFHDDYNLTTSDFLLDDYFGVEIDNELFEQYFKQIQNISDQTKFKSLNFEQNIPNVVTDVFHIDYFGPDFSFAFSPLARRVEITNNDNYTKIVVGFLNSLSLWLNVCILDMGAYVYQIFRLSLHLYYLLIWIRAYFRRIIDALATV